MFAGVLISHHIHQVAAFRREPFAHQLEELLCDQVLGHGDICEGVADDNVISGRVAGEGHARINVKNIRRSGVKPEVTHGDICDLWIHLRHGDRPVTFAGCYGARHREAAPADEEAAEILARCAQFSKRVQHGGVVGIHERWIIGGAGPVHEVIEDHHAYRVIFCFRDIYGADAKIFAFGVTRAWCGQCVACKGEADYAGEERCTRQAACEPELQESHGHIDQRDER